VTFLRLVYVLGQLGAALIELSVGGKYLFRSSHDSHGARGHWSESVLAGASTGQLPGADGWHRYQPPRRAQCL